MPMVEFGNGFGFSKRWLNRWTSTWVFKGMSAIFWTFLLSTLLVALQEKGSPCQHPLLLLSQFCIFFCCWFLFCLSICCLLSLNVYEFTSVPPFYPFFWNCNMLALIMLYVYICIYFRRTLCPIKTSKHQNILLDLYDPYHPWDWYIHLYMLTLYGKFVEKSILELTPNRVTVTISIPFLGSGITVQPSYCWFVQKSQGQPPFGWCMKPYNLTAMNKRPGSLKLVFFCRKISHQPVVTGDHPGSRWSGPWIELQGATSWWLCWEICLPMTSIRTWKMPSSSWRHGSFRIRICEKSLITC